MRIRYVLAICVLSCSTVSILAQEMGKTVARTVQFDPIRTGAPFKFIKVYLNGVEVEPGVPFQASDRWFNRLQVVLKNVSAKNLVYVAGQLRFPQTGDASAEHLAAMDRISIGRRPEHARSADLNNRRNAAGLWAHVDGPEILVRPGQEIAVPVVDPFDAIKTAIESRQSLSTLTICQIGINQLFFDDGTEWLSGVFFRADPSGPGRYVRISQKEFEASDMEARH